MVRKMPKPTKWTDEVIQFMIENYQGKDNIELAELLNSKFNLNTNSDRVSNVKANLKRRKGINLNTGINKGCIRKGHIPFNKGTKGLTSANKTSFKKGHTPANYRKVGSERVTVDGFVEIKVANPNKWVIKARMIYEKHYGKIPKNYIIIYLDGNKQNLEIDNLRAISRKEHLILNQNNLRYNNKEVTETSINLAKVMSKAGLR
jgi:hypothetical protein